MSKAFYKLEQANKGSFKESTFSITNNNSQTPTEFEEEHSTSYQIIVRKERLPQLVSWSPCVLQPGLLCLIYLT